jgi:hypothetical protein
VVRRNNLDPRGLDPIGQSGRKGLNADCRSAWWPGCRRLVLAVLVLSLGVGGGMPGWSATDRWSSALAAPIKAAAPARFNVSETSPPATIQALRPFLDKYQPQVAILSPKPNEVLGSTSATVQFQVKDLPIFKDAALGLGPHLHTILDNQPYQAVYDLNAPLVLKDLTPGTHTLRVFASRPWHESFKNDGAFAQTTFHVLTKTQENAPTDQPLLTYSRPQGTYGAEPIMLDFYLTNAPLHLAAQADAQDDLPDWRVRATVNGSSFMLDQWQPIYLKGLPPGQNWVQLELIDDQGNPVPNLSNNTARLFTYSPGGTDTLAKLTRGELTAAEARSVVDPTYTYKSKSKSKSKSPSTPDQPPSPGSPSAVKSPDVNPEMKAPDVKASDPKPSDLKAQPQPKADSSFRFPPLIPVPLPFRKAMPPVQSPGGMPSESKSDSKPESLPVQPSAKAAAKTVPPIGAPIAPKAAPKAELKVEPKVEPQAEPKVAPKAELKVAPKAEPKVAPKADPQADPQAESQAAPKVEPKVAPKADVNALRPNPLKAQSKSVPSVTAPPVVPPIRPSEPIVKPIKPQPSVTIQPSPVAPAPSPAPSKPNGFLNTFKFSGRKTPPVTPVVPMRPKPMVEPMPKVELPKVELPKVELPKVEAPKVEQPRSLKTPTPKVELPKPLKVDIPQVKLPQLPKVALPKLETPKVEVPKTLTTGQPSKIEVLKTTPAPEPVKPQASSEDNLWTQFRSKFKQKATQPSEEASPEIDLPKATLSPDAAPVKSAPAMVPIKSKSEPTLMAPIKSMAPTVKPVEPSSDKPLVSPPANNPFGGFMKQFEQKAPAAVKPDAAPMKLAPAMVPMKSVAPTQPKSEPTMMAPMKSMKPKSEPTMMAPMKSMKPKSEPTMMAPMKSMKPKSEPTMMAPMKSMKPKSEPTMMAPMKSMKPKSEPTMMAPMKSMKPKSEPTMAPMAPMAPMKLKSEPAMAPMQPMAPTKPMAPIKSASTPPNPPAAAASKPAAGLGSIDDLVRQLKQADRASTPPNPQPASSTP